MLKMNLILLFLEIVEDKTLEHWKQVIMITLQWVIDRHQIRIQLLWIQLQSGK